jgi:hypothetical protein
MRKWETEFKHKIHSDRARLPRPAGDSRRPAQPSPKVQINTQESNYSLRYFLREYGLMQYYRVLAI